MPTLPRFSIAWSAGQVDYSSVLTLAHRSRDTLARCTDVVMLELSRPTDRQSRVTGRITASSSSHVCDTTAAGDQHDLTELLGRRTLLAQTARALGAADCISICSSTRSTPICDKLLALTRKAREPRSFIHYMLVPGLCEGEHDDAAIGGEEATGPPYSCRETSTGSSLTMP